MTAPQERIAPELLVDIRDSMAAELYFAFDILSTHRLPPHQDSPRQRAEWREARRILHHLKHPDFDAPVAAEEMEWALHKVIDSCDSPALTPVAHIMRLVAAELHLDIGRGYHVPRELDKKIGNAMKVLLQQRAAEAPLAATA